MRLKTTGHAVLAAIDGPLSVLVWWFASSALGALAICSLYLIKSALGIDLLPGPSPLHDLLYPLIARG